MPKQLLLFFLLINSTYLCGQSQRKNLTGFVISDGKTLEGIHVINKNTAKGTITNGSGKFEIPVKENDTLIFSGVQFYYKEILIHHDILKGANFSTELFLKINELEEVEVRSHNLSGRLFSDSANVKDTISNVSDNALDFSMIDFKKPVISDIDEVDRTKPPDITHLVTPGSSGAGAKIGLKKLRTKEEKQLEKLKERFDILDKIKALITESYLIDSLKIPREQIDSFLEHCKSKGLIELYNNQQNLELIELLISESKIFKE